MALSVRRMVDDPKRFEIESIEARGERRNPGAKGVVEVATSTNTAVRLCDGSSMERIVVAIESVHAVHVRRANQVTLDRIGPCA